MHLLLAFRQISPVAFELKCGNVRNMHLFLLNCDDDDDAFSYELPRFEDSNVLNMITEILQVIP